MPVDSTWEARELPVLEAIVRLYDETAQAVRASQIVEATGLSEQEVQRALKALLHESPPFFESGGGRLSTRGILLVGKVTGHARRTVGAWPTPENLADRIVAALNEAADNAETADEKTKLKKAAEAVGGVGRGVLTGVLTHVITQGV